MLDEDEKYVINFFPPSYNFLPTVYNCFHSEVYDYLDKVKQLNSYLSGKCIVVGNADVGKTSILKRFGHNIFTENYKLTIGVDFDVHDFKILDYPFKLNIWDTAGEERFRAITQTYYRNTHIALIIFDLSNINTLSSAKKWADEVLEYGSCKNNYKESLDEPIFFLIGTKKDLLCKSAFEFVESEAFKVAKELNAEYWSVSSRTGENINKMFKKIAATTFCEIVLREVEKHQPENINNNSILFDTKKIYANNFVNSNQNKIKTKKSKYKCLNKKIKSLNCFK